MAKVGPVNQGQKDLALEPKMPAGRETPKLQGRETIMTDECLEKDRKVESSRESEKGAL